MLELGGPGGPFGALAGIACYVETGEEEDCLESSTVVGVGCDEGLEGSVGGERAEDHAEEDLACECFWWGVR